MRHRLRLALVLAIGSALLSTGCISTEFRPASGSGVEPRPPVEPSSVRVLSRPPSGPFTVLGEIEAVVSGYYSDKEVLARIRIAAAQKGANAVVFVRDVSMMAAAGEGDPDSAWRKRSSLVYRAILLPDAPTP